MQSDSFWLDQGESLIEETCSRVPEREGLARGCVAQVEGWQVSWWLGVKERCEVGFQGVVKEGLFSVWVEGGGFGSGEKS